MRRPVPLLAPLLAFALAACTGGAAPAPAPTPTRTVASPEPVRPASGSVSGGLVYATDTAVHHLPRGGPARRLAAAGDVRALAISAAGRYAVWVTARGTLAVRDLAGPGYRELTGMDVSAIGVTFDGFVVVDVDETSRLLRIDPDLFLRGGEPADTALVGVQYARLFAARGARVLVAAGEAADRGEAVYDVAKDGSLTRLFLDDDPLPRPNLHRLPMEPAGLTADGLRVVYSTGIRANGNFEECTLDFGVTVRDLTTGRVVPMGKAPTLGRDVWTIVHSVATGADGKTVVGFGTEIASCAGEPPRGAAYAVDGDRWTHVAKGAIWAATGPDGRLATLSAEGVLTVGGRRIATGVRLAAWSPS